jgi:hypothetical protein
MKQFTTFSRLTSGLVVAACSALACGNRASSKSESVGETHEHWWVIGSSKTHPAEVVDALAFLKPSTRAALALDDTKTDLNWPFFGTSQYEGIPTKFHSSFHFDNCRFSETTILLNEHYRLAVAALDPDPQKTNLSEAAKNFAFALHTAQDFYAHSNWVEAGETGLVDSLPGEWKVLTPGDQVGSKQMVVVGAPMLLLPAYQGAKFTLDAPKHLLNVSLSSGDTRLGLMTGVYSENRDHHHVTACLQADPPLSMRHGDNFSCYPEDVVKACPTCSFTPLIQNNPDSWASKISPAQEEEFRVKCREIWTGTYLAKDHPPAMIAALSRAPMPEKVANNIAAMEAWRKAAYRLAMRQTTHEFCRLRNLVCQKWGMPGVDTLYSNWVSDPDSVDVECGAITAQNCMPVTPAQRQSYEDRTYDWGLSTVGGTRLSVADLDSDGFPDLIARDATDEPSSAGILGKRHVWVMRHAGSRFDEFTEPSHLLLTRGKSSTDPKTNAGAAQVFAFADVDNDGHLDAFSGSSTTRRTTTSDNARAEVLLNARSPLLLGQFTTFAAKPFGSTIQNPAGAVFFDHDADGRIDLFVPAARARPAGLVGWMWRGTGDAAQPFVEVTDQLGLRGTSRFVRGATACDLNEDGRDELLVTALTREVNLLYQAAPDGSFVQRGIASHFAYDADQEWKTNQRAQAFCVYARQGKAPLKSYATQSECPTSGCPTECNGSFPCDTFRTATDDERASCVGVPVPPSSRAKYQYGDAIGWNHATDSQADRLGGNSFSSICADFDGDGHFDVFAANERSSLEGSSADPATVLRNKTFDGGALPGANVDFERLSPQDIGIAPSHVGTDAWTDGIHTAAAFDYDNDGRVDLFVGSADAEGTRGRLFRNTSPAPGTIRFEAVPLPDLPRSEGAAAADFDRDGDIDLVVGYSSFRCGNKEFCDNGHLTFLENTGPTSGTHWLGVRLDGGDSNVTHVNKAAIGAVAKVQLGGRAVLQRVDGGHGHYGAQDSMTLHFGLGGAERRLVAVDIRWPSTVREVHCLERDQINDVQIQGGSWVDPNFENGVCSVPVGGSCGTSNDCKTGHICSGGVCQ